MSNAGSWHNVSAYAAQHIDGIPEIRHTVCKSDTELPILLYFLSAVGS